MFNQGDVISYLEMCSHEKVNLQRGMNFRLRGRSSVILMSVRPGAPYADRIEEEGRVLIYEGHDVPRTQDSANPKRVDQPFQSPSGRPTQNALFYQAAHQFKEGKRDPEVVRVYEKIRPGIWVYNGRFALRDAWLEPSGRRKVFKFKLELVDSPPSGDEIGVEEPDHSRVISTEVKLAVWKRDKGRCVRCGSVKNLHFDHIIPYSKGGSSSDAKNIQLLCGRHNLEKKDSIE